MDEKQLVAEMTEILNENGEIRFVGYEGDVFIQSIDDKEGYSYISSTNEGFDSSKDAIEWALDQFGGLENIDEWE